MKTNLQFFFHLLLLSLLILTNLPAQSESSDVIGISPGDAQVTEPMIAVNPVDSKNFITVYSKWVDGLRRPASSRTTNGGQNWSSTEVPSSLYRYPGGNNERPDPTVTFDADGNAHFCYMDEQIYPFRRDVVVAHSTDKGESWHDTSVVYDYLRFQTSYRADKPWITADCNSSSLYKNSQYVAFTAIYNWGSGNEYYSILFSYKRPGAYFCIPFQIRQSVTGTQTVFGAFPVVGLDGTVYVFWGLQTQSSSSIIQMVKSTNGGQSFTSPATIKSGITESEFQISFQIAHSWPYVAVNPLDGSLNLVYGSGTSIYFSYSTNGGANWSASSNKGMTPSGNAAWNPNITCSSSGKLAVVYYSSGYKVLVATGFATDQTFDVWSAGSFNFSNPYKWTDYIGIACNDYTYWGVWPAPSGTKSKIFGTHKTVIPVVENIDHEGFHFTNSKIIFDGDTYNSPYSPPSPLFAGKNYLMEPYSNTILKNGVTYTFYRWEDETGELISSNSLIDIPIDNHRYRARYSPPSTININADNNFIAPDGITHGIINVDNNSQTAPYSFSKVPNVNVTLQGLTQEDNQGYVRSWNLGGSQHPNFPSKWEKWLPGNPNPVDKGSSNPLDFTTTIDDDDAIYKANLRRLYQISVAYKTESGTNPNGWETEIFEQNSGNVWAQPNLPGTNYNFVCWEDNIEAPNPRPITPLDNETYTAVYKWLQRSNDPNAYKYNNQRKFLRTPNGTLHSTYQSLNGVWYEISTNNGQTWQLIGFSIESNPNWIHSEPSISYYINSANQTVVVQTWRLQRGDPYDWIRYRDYVYESTTPIISDEQEVNQEHPEMTVEEQTSPIVACASDGKTLFVWENKIEGSPRKFKFAFGKKISTYWEWYDTGTFEFTTSDVSSPSVYASIINNNLKFHFAWTERNSIYYCYLYPDVQNQIMNSSVENVSYNSGYSSNYNPRITTTDWVVSGTRYEHIRLAWIGYRDAYTDNPPPCAVSAGETRMLFKTRSSIWSPLGVYGNNVNSVSTNKGTNVINNWEPFAIAWSEGVNCNYPNKYIRSHDGTKPPIRSLNTTGSEIQLNNATDFTTMYVNSFNRPSIPYYFTLSQNLSGALGKIESMGIFLGREGVITKDSTDFYYAVGDVTLDGQNIDFIEMPDSLVINNIQIMNDYLSSEPFTVSNASTLTYGIQYGIIDSLEAVNALSDSSEISFKVEMVDNQTGEVLGVFDEISYSSENVFQYNNIGYQVDLTGIGNRTVQLRLSVGTTAACDYSISNRYSDTEILNKNGYKQITYKEIMSVKEYELEHNYPNPFNPTTTIKYQIPTSGNVTIKVYDILGNEVAKLVDGYMETGKYEVDFDASLLASGVYIYRLNVNDFVNVKKMVLLR